MWLNKVLTYLLSQTRVTRNEIGEIYIGLPVQDFKIISTDSLIRETKQMQSSIKKSDWIIDHLKISWCAVSLSSFTRFFTNRNRDFDP